MPIDQPAFWIPPTTVHPLDLHTRNTQDVFIPAPVARTPKEILQSFYGREWNQIRDWTDPDGILRLQLATWRDHRQHVARPIGSSGLIGVWPRPNDLEAVRVPSDGAGILAEAPEFVEFRNQQRRGPSTGVSMLDIWEGHWQSVKDGEELVLNRFRCRGINLTIAWPGYDIETFTIEGGPYPRAELAWQIVSAYDRFFKKVEKDILLPNDVGFFNIALHQGPNARDNSLGVQFSQLHLVSFCHTIDGAWVAEVDIV